MIHPELVCTRVCGEEERLPEKNREWAADDDHTSGTKKARDGVDGFCFL
jgi:hypothetical protein